MCDCPEIQGVWQPKIGDYMWRKYTVFGEEIDRTIWPADQREEVIILHWKSEADGYYSAVNREGDERIFNSMEEMNKATCIWLPRQDQLQEMLEALCGTWEALLVELSSWHSPWGALHNEYASSFKSFEQAWLAFVMHEKHNKHWNGEEWV